MSERPPLTEWKNSTALQSTFIVSDFSVPHVPDRIPAAEFHSLSLLPTPSSKNCLRACIFKSINLQLDKSAHSCNIQLGLYIYRRRFHNTAELWRHLLNRNEQHWLFEDGYQWWHYVSLSRTNNFLVRVVTTLLHVPHQCIFAWSTDYWSKSILVPCRKVPPKHDEVSAMHVN